MKILFIHPQRKARQSSKKSVQAYIPPLTIPTLAGLTPAGIDVELCDESVEDVNFNTGADLIGITGITSQINRAYEIADAFRARGKRVILGGIHATALPEEAKQHADSVVIGEAEDIWEELIQDCRDNRLKEEYQAGRYSDLRNLVIPRYELFKLDRYRRSTGTKLPRLPIQVSRGCPFNCNFCSVTKFWGPKIRTKPLANVEQELLNIKSLGTDRVFFTDDNFIANIDYTRELLKLIRKHQITFFCQVSTNIQKHEDIIAEMGRARCTGVYMGIESLSDESLASLNKKVNRVADYTRLFTMMNKANIQVTASMMMGLDGDTAESVANSIRKLQDLGVGHLQLYLPALFPGTEFRDRLIRAERVTDLNWDNQNASSVTFKPKNFNEEQLSREYWRLYKQFYSYKSISERILSPRVLKLGPKTALTRLRTNLYYRKRLQNGLHPYEN